MMDEHTAPPYSGIKRRSLSPCASSSTRKRPKLDIPLAQMTELKAFMKIFSTLYRFDKEDNDQQRAVFTNVFLALMSCLQKTDLKASGGLVSCANFFEAYEIVQGFNDQELVEWKEGVRKGVEESDWTNLISHLTVMKPARSVSSTLDTPEWQATRLHQMFSQSYRGDAVTDFVRALSIYHDLYDASQHFGRSIPFVQSSCTGKSRLVEELGNEVPTLSICFRNDGLPRNGWPPRDEPACNFFMRPREVRFKGEELSAAFLGALFHVVTEKLKAKATNIRVPNQLMDDWRLDTPTDVTASSRYKCFLEVETKAESLLTQERSTLEGWRLPSPQLGNPSTGAVGQPAADWHLKLYRALCHTPAQNLSDLLTKLDHKFFVVVFDECSYLHILQSAADEEPVRHPLWGMTLIALQRIIKAGDTFDYQGLTFWHLFLDTTLSIFDLAPNVPKVPSLRLMGEFVTLPPWPYLGFNQMVDENHCTGIEKPADVLSVNHQKVYGRPYWSYLSHTEVLAVASSKLFYGSKFVPTDEDHVFAALSVRLGLEIGEGEASVRLATEAVRSHMRILINVVGPLVITASPSEPILAIVAAQALNTSARTYQGAIETLINKLVLRGVVLDRGLQGGLYSRLLLMLARDKAVVNCGKSFVMPSPDGVPTVQAVTLSRFLQTLLGQNLGIPGNTPDKTTLLGNLLEGTSKLWINFTHFVQMPGCINDISPSMLLEAWSSGFAIQCAFQQEVIDGFIVAYAGDLNGPFDIGKLLPIPWQTKARSKAANLAIARRLTAPFLVEIDKDNNIVRRKPEYVAILMDLTASSAFGQASGPNVDLTYAIAEHPSEKRDKWGGYARDGEVEPGRYCLNVRGHGSSVYPVLQGFDSQFDHLFQRVLACSQPELAEFQEAMERAMERVEIRDMEDDSGSSVEMD